MKRTLTIVLMLLFFTLTISADCKKTEERKFSVEGTFGWTHVSNSENWLYDMEKFTYFHSDSFNISLYHEGFSRYGQRDDLIGTKATFKPLELTTFVVDFFYTPKNDFIARTRSSFEIIQNFWWHRELVFSLGYSFFDFGDDLDGEYAWIHMLTPGIEYYLPLGFFAGYKAFLVVNRESELIHAHMGYFAWDHSKFLATLGFSIGEEFIAYYSSKGIEVRSFFARGLIKVLCPFYIGVQYQFTTSVPDSKRNEITGMLRYDF
jgi:hypothetical protein